MARKQMTNRNKINETKDTKIIQKEPAYENKQYNKNLAKTETDHQKRKRKGIL